MKMSAWKLCRACLTSKDSFSYNLFKNVSVETYLFCTSVHVMDNDGLPKNVCDDCYELLNKCYHFKQTCIQSQTTLLSCNRVKYEDTPIGPSYEGSLIDSDNDNEGLKYSNDCYSVKYEDTTVVGPSNKGNVIGNVDMKQENLNHLNSVSLTETHLDYPAAVEQEQLLLPYGFGDLPLQQKCNLLSSRENKSLFKRQNKSKRKLQLKHLKSAVKSEQTRKPFVYSCEACNKRFRNPERFEAHQKEHDGKRVSLYCTPCGKSFVTWSGLARHRESKHSSARLSSLACSTCGRVCTSRNSLRVHERKHGGPQKVQAACVCHVCGKSVSSAVILRTHLETHREDRERRYTCEHCGKKFFTNAMLLSHIARQHTDRRYVCDYCRYPFTDKYNLAKHILVHEGKKLYSCEICDKSFATNGSLVEHRRIHSGERPFGCNYCQKSFLSKRRLTDHIRIHTGDKPHKCSVCEQRFTQKGTMQRHVKTHLKTVSAVQ